MITYYHNHEYCCGSPEGCSPSPGKVVSGRGRSPGNQALGNQNQPRVQHTQQRLQQTQSQLGLIHRQQQHLQQQQILLQQQLQQPQMQIQHLQQLQHQQQPQIHHHQQLQQQALQHDQQQQQIDHHQLQQQQQQLQRQQHHYQHYHHHPHQMEQTPNSPPLNLHPLLLQPLPLQSPQRNYSSCTLPASMSKSRGKFTNLRDSVRKSPTKSTAKVRATHRQSGWWSDDTPWATLSLEKPPQVLMTTAPRTHVQNLTDPVDRCAFDKDGGDERGAKNGLNAGDMEDRVDATKISLEKSRTATGLMI
ncbi:myb-like protein I [Oncorhynchus nerka]|uniref:myb-like protein I n=1 Tax=Oncorhynchus nerka TaxID=8023 RepID=UPI0031B89AFA